MQSLDCFFLSVSSSLLLVRLFFLYPCHVYLDFLDGRSISNQSKKKSKSKKRCCCRNCSFAIDSIYSCDLSKVQGTNDSSILSKVSMTKLGYFDDLFLREFVDKDVRRSPSINRFARELFSSSNPFVFHFQRLLYSNESIGICL